jgi:hypothetical protein
VSLNVGQTIGFCRLSPAEFHEKARGRRLKAGGSQDRLPHKA